MHGIPIGPVFAIYYPILAAIGVPGNRARRGLLTRSNREHQSDPEIEKRRKSIVLLFGISGSFILLYLLYFVTIIYVRIANISYSSGSDVSKTIFVVQQSGYMLQLLSSCINPFIYAGTQSKIREEVTNGLKYPLRFFTKMFKKIK
ncbi:uncharacterized protein LOC125454563 isoform X2 [Stegostoma tigrinum]|uniref:uncharacterized protein LOC125454563 isoform X2 n=1 Tax=Stegostoma tigrinum TaxID=3053191 RepID=UPI00287068B6|nr:uncharacterized protein LOC125454563 isoform X2 [Stegostoma tigrinum]